MERESLYKNAQKAIATTRENAIFGGYSMDKAYKALRELDSPSNYSREYLFERAARMCLAVAANQFGDRAGKRRSGVYFDKNIENVSVQMALLQNKEHDVDAHTAKAEEIKETCNVVISKKAMDGQLRMDTDNPNNYQEEISIERMIELILAADE